MLFETYTEGFEIHRNYLPITRQLSVLSAIRRVLSVSPLYRPKFYGKGFVSEYALENVNCGKWGWRSDEKGFRYSETDINGNAIPPIPNEIMEIVNELAPSNFVAENCLINFYQDRIIDGKVKKSHLGLHQDKTEKDLTAPIISISIGQAAIFQLGGLEKTDPIDEIEVVSGDVMIMAGKARNSFHGIKHLIPNSCPKELNMKTEARLNLTIRQVDKQINKALFYQDATKEYFRETYPKEFDEIQKRDEFQSNVPASEIKRLQNKMLDFHLRTRDDHPGHGFTKAERLLYADYLESKGELLGDEMTDKIYRDGTIQPYMFGEV